jgi:hypothetical protein
VQVHRHSTNEKSSDQFEIAQIWIDLKVGLLMYIGKPLLHEIGLYIWLSNSVKTKEYTLPWEWHVGYTERAFHL